MYHTSRIMHTLVVATLVEYYYRTSTLESSITPPSSIICNQTSGGDRGYEALALHFEIY